MLTDCSVAKDRLRSALARSGWEVEAIEQPDVWWIEEAWSLKSVWSPQGERAYLTFLVDPQSTSRTTRPVWAVKASRALPTQWQDAANEPVLVFGSLWQSRVSGFVSELSRFREPNAA